MNELIEDLVLFLNENYSFSAEEQGDSLVAKATLYLDNKGHMNTLTHLCPNIEDHYFTEERLKAKREIKAKAEKKFGVTVDHNDSEKFFELAKALFPYETSQYDDFDSWIRGKQDHKIEVVLTVDDNGGDLSASIQLHSGRMYFLDKDFTGATIGGFSYMEAGPKKILEHVILKEFKLNRLRK